MFKSSERQVRQDSHRPETFLIRPHQNVLSRCITLQLTEDSYRCNPLLLWLLFTYSHVLLCSKGAFLTAKYIKISWKVRYLGLVSYLNQVISNCPRGQFQWHHTGKQTGKWTAEMSDYNEIILIMSYSWSHKFVPTKTVE